MSRKVYYVERDGQRVEAAFYLFAAQLVCVGLAENGVNPNSLRIVDLEGNEYPKVGL